MRPKLRSSFCLGVEIPFNFFWNQQIRIMFLCRRTFFFLSCCFSFLCRSLNNLCFSMFCYSIDAWRWWSEKKPTRPPTVCSQSISAVAAVFAATRRDCRKLFGKGWSRGEAQTTGEKCGKFVNCGKQIKARRRTTPATSEKSSTFFAFACMEKSLSFIQMLMYQPLNLRLVSFILCRSDVVYWSSPMLS